MRAIFIVLLWVIPVFSQTTQPLFHLERNVNANKVYYEARITSGAIDSREPVHAYWVLWAKDSTGKTREELNIVEKKMAFGLKVRRNVKTQSYSVSIVAFPQRVITVFMDNGEAKAQTVIGGKLSELEKIVITTREANPVPKVDFVELFGVDVATGKACYEKIIHK